MSTATHEGERDAKGVQESETINHVKRLTGEKLALAGLVVPVELDSIGWPYAELPLSVVADGSWKSIPDEAIMSTTRQPVQLRIVEPAPSPVFQATIKFRDWDPLGLKKRISAWLASEMFRSWRKPEIRKPDLSAGDFSPGPVVEAQYGQCPLSGKPLLAWGTIGLARACDGVRPGEIRLADYWGTFRPAIDSLNAEAAEALASLRSRKAG